ncbi:MAG: hypothetical protein ACPGES_12155, partial [Coraliomargarita sp.]
WLNGEQMLFHWNEMSSRMESEPVDLIAGERYAIQLDYFSTSSRPAVSLNWESRSLYRQRIPTQALYATAGLSVATASRDASDYMPVSSFEIASAGIQDSDVDAYSVMGLRQRSFGETGAYLGYEALRFSGKETQVKVHGVGRESGDHQNFPVTVEVRLGSPSGVRLAEVTLPKAAGTVSVPLEVATSGEQTLYVVNSTTDEWHYIDLRWLRFE